MGGAPVKPEILSFFQSMGFLCVQGYGLTECAPILALNRDKFFKNESAGLPLPGCTVKILNPDENGIGEFISKGDNNFMGYYNDPENTAIALDSDGFITQATWDILTRTVLHHYRTQEECYNCQEW